MTEQDFLPGFEETLEEEKRWIMISIEPKYYEELTKGLKKYEYRRGNFIKEPVKAFVYCSSPKKEVGAIIDLGEPIYGDADKIAKIKEEEVAGSYDMMMEWMEGFKKSCAVPIKSVKVFDSVKLEELREKFKFHPPQRFMYLDKKPELLTFLKKKSGVTGPNV